MRDTNLFLKASASSTTTSNFTGVDFGAADEEPLTYVINGTAKSGTTPTMDCEIQQSDDNSTWVPFLKFPQMTGTNMPGLLRVTGVASKRYRRLAVTTQGGTTPNFTFECFPELGGEYKSF